MILNENFGVRDYDNYFYVSLNLQNRSGDPPNPYALGKITFYQKGSSEPTPPVGVNAYYQSDRGMIPLQISDCVINPLHILEGEWDDRLVEGDYITDHPYSVFFEFIFSKGVDLTSIFYALPTLYPLPDNWYFNLFYAEGNSSSTIGSAPTSIVTGSYGLLPISNQSGNTSGRLTPNNDYVHDLDAWGSYLFDSPPLLDVGGLTQKIRESVCALGTAYNDATVVLIEERWGSFIEAQIPTAGIVLFENLPSYVKFTLIAVDNSGTYAPVVLCNRYASEDGSPTTGPLVSHF